MAMGTLHLYLLPVWKRVIEYSIIISGVINKIMCIKHLAQGTVKRILPYNHGLLVNIPLVLKSQFCE